MPKFENAYYENIFTLLAESIEGSTKDVHFNRMEKQVHVYGTFCYNGDEYAMTMVFAWNKDGTEGKPVTTLRFNENKLSWGRFPLWNDFREVVEDMISGANNLLDEAIDAKEQAAH